MSLLARWRIPLARVGARCLASEYWPWIKDFGKPVILSTDPRDLRATIRTVTGKPKPYVDIRCFFEPKDSPGKSFPTKKGIWLSVEEWEALKKSFGAVDDLMKRSQ